MELIQYTGPFASGDSITIPAQTGYTYVHIGIQVPKRQPISVPKTKLSNNNKTTTIEPNAYRESYPNTVVSINNKSYQINANGILEFDGLSEIEWTIRFLVNLPPEAIIDIVRR